MTRSEIKLSLSRLTPIQLFNIFVNTRNDDVVKVIIDDLTQKNCKFFLESLNTITPTLPDLNFFDDRFELVSRKLIDLSGILRSKDMLFHFAETSISPAISEFFYNVIYAHSNPFDILRFLSKSVKCSDYLYKLFFDLLIHLEQKGEMHVSLLMVAALITYSRRYAQLIGEAVADRPYDAIRYNYIKEVTSLEIPILSPSERDEVLIDIVLPIADSQTLLYIAQHYPSESVRRLALNVSSKDSIPLELF